VASQLFLISACCCGCLPILFALYVAIRPYSDTSKYGYVSLPHHLTLDNFKGRVDPVGHGPLLLELGADHGARGDHRAGAGLRVAFVLTRVDVKINISLLILFTAGNLLPQQVIITRCTGCTSRSSCRTFLSDKRLMYNSLFGLVVINVSFQLGFCVFVLRTTEVVPRRDVRGRAGRRGGPVDPFWRLTLPLCGRRWRRWRRCDDVDLQRLLWAITLMSSGDKRPITSALANLPGPVRQQPEPDRGRGDDRRDPDAGRLRPAAEAVHRGPVRWVPAGLSGLNGTETVLTGAGQGPE